MKGTLTKDRRITVPNEVIKQCSIEPGSAIDIVVDEQTGNIIIKNYTLEQDNKTPIEKKQVKTNGIIVESNIEDLDKYVKPILSDCGLVVRSKRKYINNFCDVCKGSLSNGGKCKFNKSIDVNINKQEIVKPVKVIKNSKTESKVKNTKTKNTINKELEEYGNTTIQPVRAPEGKLYECKKCGELCETGFILNNKFYCKRCTIDDFKNYMEKRRM